MVFHVEVNFGGLPFIAEFVEQGGDRAAGTRQRAVPEAKPGAKSFR
jgi:hypothetical protein